MAGRIKPLAVVAAVLLPPLGIFLDRGLGAPFWIACLLTLLAFVPGMLYALFLTVVSPVRA